MLVDGVGLTGQRQCTSWFTVTAVASVAAFSCSCSSWPLNPIRWCGKDQVTLVNTVRWITGEEPESLIKDSKQAWLLLWAEILSLSPKTWSRTVFSSSERLFSILHSWKDGSELEDSQYLISRNLKGAWRIVSFKFKYHKQEYEVWKIRSLQSRQHFPTCFNDTSFVKHLTQNILLIAWQNL